MRSSQISLMSQTTSNAFVCLRVFAMASIIVCHLFQAYGKYYFSSIFNVGVKIFLIMSGALYSYKTITDWSGWAKKRIEKLYVPFVLVLITVIPILSMVGGGNLRLPVIMANLLNLQGIGDVLNANLRINGLNHLWFMTSIMIAYFSLPLFQKGRNRSLLLYVLLIFLWILVFMFVTPRVMWGLEWILLFGTGYIRTFIVSQHPKRNIMESLDIMILIFTIFFATQIGIENLSSNYDKLNRIFHVLLGLSLTIWGMKMLEWLKIKKIPSLIKFFDKYSFHIYLVHFVFMIGPLSFAHVAKYDGVNIVIMLSLSAIFTFLLIMVLGFVNRQLLCKI